MTLRSALLVLPVLGLPVAAADVSGVWEMTLKSDSTTIPRLVCTFAQSGQELTGSCKLVGAPQSEAVDLTGGKFDGDRVSCQWNLVTPDGQEWTYVLTGTLDADKTTMGGTFTLSGGSNSGGSFTGKKTIKSESPEQSAMPSFRRVPPILYDARLPCACHPLARLKTI